MFRWGVSRVACLVATKPRPSAAIAQAVRNSSASTETDEQMDARYIAYFNRKDIDGWEVRKAMTDIIRTDVIPEPVVIEAALRACRRINDFALTVRFLESVKHKCGNNVGEIYPYLLQELRPVLSELGISTPEELGYDKPELWLPRVDEM